MKGKLSSGSGMLRKGLVVTQFTIAVIVLSITLLVQRQLHFMDNKPLGYNKNNLLHLKEINFDGKGNTFKNEVLSLPGVTSAAITTWSPLNGDGYRLDLDDPQHKENKLKAWYIDVDLDFARTMGLHLEQGRLLDARYGADAINSDSLMAKGVNDLMMAQIQQPELVTASTAKAFAINKLGETKTGILGKPVGVINDFNNESLRTTINPTFIRESKNIHRGGMLIRVQPGAEQQVLGPLSKLSAFLPQ